MKTRLSNLKVFLVGVIVMLEGSALHAQFNDCGSGLLSMPSANINPSGTIMLTSNLLNKNTISKWYWGYNTFSYGINITFWSRLEIGYVCVLIDGRKNPNPLNGHFAMTINQDRHFAAKLVLLKEGDFGIEWLPALCLGTSDPTTAGTGGVLPDYSEMQVSGEGNGFFNRYYCVATKHFNTHLGKVGCHLGYQFNFRTDFPMNGPCVAVDWIPKWTSTNIFSMKTILEYDTRTINAGIIASVWNNHFDVMIELVNMRWFAAGVRYKTVLKV